MDIAGHTGAATVPAQSGGLAERAHTDLSQEIPVKDAVMVATASGLGYGFDAYAVNIYGLILPTISLSLGISAATAGVIGSLFLVGYTLGTIGFGIAADRYGRKDTLGVSILMYGVTTMLGGVFPNTVWFTIMRFLTGIGGAGELAVGAPYTCEMFRTKHRALGTGGIIFSLYSLGYILAGLVAVFATPALGWRWPFIFAIFPAIAVFLFRRLIQESVRYVLDKAEDKFAAARTLLELEHTGGSAGERAQAVSDLAKQTKTHAHDSRGSAASAAPAANTGQRQKPQEVFAVGLLGAVAVAMVLFGLLDSPNLPKVASAALVTAGALMVLLTLALSSFALRGGQQRFWHSPTARRRIGIGWLLYSANAMGYWGITTFLTTFMVKKFNVDTTTAIWYAVMFYGVQFFFSYLGTGLSDRIGRRPIGILGALIMIGCTIAAATASTLGMFLVFGAIQIAMLGWLWGVSDTYLSELFPTSIRGACFGMGVGGGRVMSIAAPFLVGLGIVAFGVTTPFLISAGLWIMTIVGYLLGPETARKPLEQIEAEFLAEERATAERILVRA